jgi:hypothetical protein
MGEEAEVLLGGVAGGGPEGGVRRCCKTLVRCDSRRFAVAVDSLLLPLSRAAATCSEPPSVETEETDAARGFPVGVIEP